MSEKTLEEIFARCKPNGDCIEWTGAQNGGYAVVRHKGKSQPGTRVVYELVHGKHPGKLFVLHSCDNPPCLNPEHLSLGTAKDNCHDAVKKKRWRGMKKTHCKNGHEYTPENTVVHVNKEGMKRNGQRYCRECHRTWHREYQRRKQATKKRELSSVENS